MFLRCKDFIEDWVSIVKLQGKIWLYFVGVIEFRINLYLEVIDYVGQ